MTADAPTSFDPKERFTPEERRARLRAFADQMLERLGDLPSPYDAPELEQMTRAGLLIERIYARVDASERTASKQLTPEEVARSREEFGLKLAALRATHDAVSAKLAPKLSPHMAPEPVTPPITPDELIQRIKSLDLSEPDFGIDDDFDEDLADEAEDAPKSPPRLDPKTGILWLDERTILATQHPPWFEAEGGEMYWRVARGEVKLVLPDSITDSS
ncbi:hypothetical protein Q1W73_06160 [Asticcacaulis sp. ZE23SCel15]|uniref:hypothetical protein n=1 Tax=Asticcacaulis sp. ZE23SCel15 TaxID=3059027 RepID=UPI00265E5B09|nr:hypothetical protein [Asticcacaulis sp. ZE23SCel15]WKL58566.1 hypothetical protein Q1W73_06160 [Asticcacaulis sp. ZE23SCel15]